MAGVILFFIAVSLGLIALGASPRLYPARKFFFTASYGLTLLLSLLFPKPPGFYTGRYFVGGNDRVGEARLDAA